MQGQAQQGRGDVQGQGDIQARLGPSLPGLSQQNWRPGQPEQERKRKRVSALRSCFPFITGEQADFQGRDETYGLRRPGSRTSQCGCRLPAEGELPTTMGVG